MGLAGLLRGSSVNNYMGEGLLEGVSTLSPWGWKGIIIPPFSPASLPESNFRGVGGFHPGDC